MFVGSKTTPNTHIVQKTTRIRFCPNENVWMCAVKPSFLFIALMKINFNPKEKKLESIEYSWRIEIKDETILYIQMICPSTDCKNSNSCLLKQHKTTLFQILFWKMQFWGTCYTRIENAQNRINHTDTDIDNIRGWPCSGSSARQCQPKVKRIFLIFGTIQTVICPCYKHVVTILSKVWFPQFVLLGQDRSAGAVDPPSGKNYRLLIKF